MFGSFRAARSVAPLACVLGIAAISAPSLAAEAAFPAGNATAMLAAVTAPMIAADLDRYRQPDFSSDTAASPSTLADLVDRKSGEETASEDVQCLATSVYYESKGEPLDGQLAVAQTILNRVDSRRFADTVCGVVKQPGQFSFVSHGALPTPPQGSSAWQRAVAIARIARDGLWKQIAPAALFFHARRAGIEHCKTQVAMVGNHVFLR